MAEPRAWMRKWAFDGIDVMRMPKKDRPSGWQLHEVTRHQCLPNDVPLYTAAPSPSPAPGVVEALKRLAYEQAKDNHGYRVAGDLVANGWRWPDTAPDFVDTSLHEAIAALASLSQPAKGEREGGE